MLGIPYHMRKPMHTRKQPQNRSGYVRFSHIDTENRHIIAHLPINAPSGTCKRSTPHYSVLVHVGAQIACKGATATLVGIASVAASRGFTLCAWSV